MILTYSKDKEVIMKTYEFNLNLFPTIETNYSHVGNVKRNTNEAVKMYVGNLQRRMFSKEPNGIEIRNYSIQETVQRNYKQVKQVKIKVTGIVKASDKENAKFKLQHYAREDYWAYNPVKNIQLISLLKTY